MQQPEAKFKKHLKDGFDLCHSMKSAFWVAIVASMMQQSGLPDLFVAAEGRCVWIEAKVDDNWLRKGQALTFPQMSAAGARVIILSANMIPNKADRIISMSTYSGSTLQRDVSRFSWDAPKAPFFWGTVLGSFA